MLTFIVIIQIIVSILLTIVILMQSSKGGGLSGAFGGSGSMGAVFGGRGAGSFLSKVTIVLATIFMLGAITQGLMRRGGSAQPRSLIQQEMQKEGVTSAADILPKLPGQPGAGIGAASPGNAAATDSGK